MLILNVLTLGGWWRGGLLAAICWLTVVTSGAAPVTFTFEPSGGGDPFAREISAEVLTPSRRTVLLPAYYAGGGRFEVRARAEERGEFQLGRVLEMREGQANELPVEVVGARQRVVREPSKRLAVRTTSGRKPGGFVLTNGEEFVPLGTNLAWASGDDVAGWYRKAFRAYEKAGLNWARVWMSHWGGLNLDWLPERLGASPKAGELDERIARNWDVLIEEAEKRGIYVQVVLQHHGQWTTRVNPNWDENPWNAANAGGFLAKPREFFTSAEAARVTRQKYRYIVARWGYSPAVMAWELFNEVHWVDAMRLDDDEAAVARWHDAMAEHIRSVDAYRHPVTTSTEDLHSAIYASMDYLQPHLYARNMLAALRRFDVSPATMERPVFYGEMGNDHMRLTPEQKRSGIELAPLAWAGVMGEGALPAQVWEGDKLIERGRVDEMRALARFMKTTRLALREELRPFSAAVESATRVPLELEAGRGWHRGEAPDITVPADGRQPAELGTMPQILVGAPRSIAEGYPAQATLRIAYPTPARARLRFSNAGVGGAKVRVQVDGELVGEQVWAPIADAPAAAKARPAELAFTVDAGERTIVIENVGGEDWVEFEALDFGLETAMLATCGRRGDGFIALWVWHREGVFALKDVAAARGEIVVEDVAPGDWRVTWWDTQRGRPLAAKRMTHPGGPLRVATPAIHRHAAVVLERGD